MGDIQFHHEDIGQISVNQSDIKVKIKKLIKAEGKIVGDINLIFCSDNYMLDINKKYLEHDYFTDIITFDYVEGMTISGDLFLSIDRIKENADTFAVPFSDELLRVIYHGILHLIGYGDKTDGEKLVMRGKENNYLEQLK